MNVAAGVTPRDAGEHDRHRGDRSTTVAKSGTMPQVSMTWPATRKPSGAASVFAEITAIMTFARRSSGVRAVRTAISGPLPRGVKNVARKSAPMTTGQGGRNGCPARYREGEDPEGGEAQRRHPLDREHCEDAADDCTRAKRGVEEAGDPGAPVELVVRVHG
jgi:hypothetical protein